MPDVNLIFKKFFDLRYRPDIGLVFGLTGIDMGKSAVPLVIEVLYQWHRCTRPPRSDRAPARIGGASFSAC